jgi:archaellum component FlaC
MASKKETPKSSMNFKTVAITILTGLGLLVFMTATVSAFTSEVEKKQAEFDMKLMQIVELEVEQQRIEEELAAARAERAVIEQELATAKLGELGEKKFKNLTPEERQEIHRLEYKIQPLEVGSNIDANQPNLTSHESKGVKWV